jgi:hypothetical protein
LIGVIVTFRFDEADFDAARLGQIATAAHGKFVALPGLRSKVFTIDAAGRRAVNVYVWDDADAARAFFSDAAIDGVAQRYGVRPDVTFVEIAGIVDSAAH